MNLFGDDTESLFYGLIELIRKWNPKVYADEGKYQQDLYNYLKMLQNKGTIKKERTIRREAGESRADLRVSNVAIELKKNLESKSQRDRAENQIRLMLKEFDYVIVAIVGDNKKEAVDTFEHHLQDFKQEDNLLGEGKKIKVLKIKSNGSKEYPQNSDDGNDEDNEGESNSFSNGFEIPKVEIPKINIPKLKIPKLF